MRKILLVLFVFGLVLALGAPASAVDIKVSGSYYATGMFISDPSLRAEDYRAPGYHVMPTDGKAASSASFVGQRLRLQPEFKIAEGLTLTTRFDALEKKWGDTSWNRIHGYDNTNRPVDQQNATNWDTYAINGSSIRTQENLEWERAYVDFNTAIGRFMVGYFDCICYGTLFLNTHVSRAGVKYMYPMGPWTFGAQWEKPHEGGSYGIAGGSRLLYADKDLDVYSIMVDYRWKTGVAGVQFQYYKDTYNDYSNGDATGAYRSNLYTINPYFQAAIGNLGLEGEFWYGFGDWKDYNTGSADDVELDAYAAYLNAKFGIGNFYIGLLGAIESGDQNPSDDKQKGSVLGGTTFVMGQAWDPFLYMFNDLVNTYTGNWYGYNTSSIGTFEDNCMLFKLYGGWNVTPKLNVEVAYGMAWADDTPSGVDDSYGSEFDIFATYKIYNNLSYMVGFGYWWVGDYFKGTVSGADLEDSYLLMHKLTLAF